MEITGRVTADATLNTTKSGKQVVNFSIAINDGYKPKNADYQNLVTYFRCSYWLDAKAAGRLKKGTVVTLNGRLDMDVYQSKKNDQWMGAIRFHVNSVRVIAKAPLQEATAEVMNHLPASDLSVAVSDDLPF